MKDDNRFRPQYRVLNQVERDRIDLLKDQAASLCTTIEALPESRERSIAITKLEEAVMWAVKAQTA